MVLTLRWTPYGGEALAELRRVVSEAKSDDAMALTTVIVPSHLAGTVARRALAASMTRSSVGGGGRGVAALAVLTVDRLAELVAAPRLVASGRRPMTAPVAVTAWQRELAADPVSFAPVVAHPATVTALVEAHRRLRDLSREALDRISGVDQLRSDVIHLFDRVVGRLAGGYYDVHDLRTTATQLMASDGVTLARGLGRVVVFLPQDLDRSAAELVSAVAVGAPTTVIAGSTGDPRSDRGVVRSLQRLGVMGVDAPGVFSAGTRPEVGDVPSARQVPTATRVVHASDSEDEVRQVVRLVVAALRDSPARRVAVLYGNAVPYARLLHEQLESAGVTVNGPGVRSAAERVLPRALLQLLDLPSAGYSRPRVFGFLAGAPVRDGEGRMVPASRWERVSRAAGVVGGGDWQERLDRYAAEQRSRAQQERDNQDGPRDWLVERHERAAESAESLAAFVSDLRDRLTAGEQAVDWGALAAWALDTVRSVFGTAEDRWRLPEEERAAGELLERFLEGLAGLDDVARGGASLPALRQLLELQLADDRLRVGRYGTGVLVAPLSAAVGLEADHVFVTGLAEDLCPGRPSEDALLPDAARETSGGELPLLRDRLDVQHRQLLAAFAAAPEVTATFPRGDLRRSSERLPSRWLLATFRALTGDGEVSTSTWQSVACERISGGPSYATSIVGAPPPVLATEQEWRQRALVADPSLQVLARDGVLSRGSDLVRARQSSTFTRFDGNLSAHRGRLPDPADGERVVSATQLEGWVACPHAYFVGRVLGVEPVDDPEERVSLSPLDRGSILHEALDRFFAWLKDTDGPPGPDQPWTIPQRNQLQVIGGQVADEFAWRGLAGHPTLWVQERARLLDDLDQVLDQDEVLRRDERRQQIRSELEFGKGRWPQPVVVRLPDGRAVLLRGSADRLDQTEDGTLVVSDFKSGKADSYRVIGQDGGDPTVGGSKLQLPVYAYAARQRTARPDAPVRAEYWFIGPRDRGVRVRCELTLAVEHRYAEVLAVVADGIGGGLFPANAPEDRPWSRHPACPYCDPDGRGAKERRTEWERKKTAPALRGYLGLIDPDSTVALGGRR